MPQLAAAAPYIGLALSASQAITQGELGKAQKAEAGIQAIDKENEANQAQAESQRDALTQRKRARYLRSRALAVAGASGGGVSDPTVSNILTGIDTQGDMDFMSALYSGDYNAHALRKQADTLRRTGRLAESQGYQAGASTLLRGGLNFASDNPSFFSKYGDVGNVQPATGSELGLPANFSYSGLNYVDGVR